MTPGKYTNDSQQRILRYPAVIGPHPAGLLPSDIAKLLNLSPQNVTRDLSNLIEAGVVEVHNQRYRLTSQFCAIGVNASRLIQTHIARETERLGWIQSNA